MIDGKLDSAIFNAFIDSRNKIELYNSVVKIAKEYAAESVNYERDDFCKLLSQLHDNENNAGWQERHSDRIKILWDAIHKYDTDIAE